MAEHLDPASPAFWGALIVADEWRLIVQSRGGYALQTFTGSAWDTVEAFPTAGWLCAHLHGVYDVPSALREAADMFPELPPKVGPNGWRCCATLVKTGRARKSRETRKTGRW